MNGVMFDDRLLTYDTIPIHHFSGAICFRDIPMPGYQLDGIFIVIGDVNGVYMQIL